MMNWEAIGAIGEIVGALAVVISLLYLATQIRTQNREARTASAHEILEAFRGALALLKDRESADIFLRGTSDYDALDDVEKMQYIAIAQNFLRVWEEAYYQYREQRLQEHVWSAMDAYFSQFIGTNGAKRVWELRGFGFSESFREHIGHTTPREFRIK